MMEINESIIFYGVLSFMCIEFAWEFYLDFRQVGSRILDGYLRVKYIMISCVHGIAVSWLSNSENIP